MVKIRHLKKARARCLSEIKRRKKKRQSTVNLRFAANCINFELGMIKMRLAFKKVIPTVEQLREQLLRHKSA